MHISPGYLIEQNRTKVQSTSVERLVFDWVRQSNKIEHLFWCQFDFRINRTKSKKIKMPSSVNDFKRSSPRANLLLDEKLFSHYYTEPTLLVHFYTTRNLDTCSVLPGLLDVAYWRFWDGLKAGCKDMSKGKGKASSDLTLGLNFHILLAIIGRENWKKKEKSSLIKRSIQFDSPSFGNRTFDCVWLAKFYSKFDWVRLRSAIERLVFDWVRLPNCSIRYPGKLARELLHDSTNDNLTFWY